MPTENSLKYCPGLIHLRAQLRKLIAATPDTDIMFFDGEDWEEFDRTETGVMAAAEAAAEMDAIVLYQVGDARVQVIYDGPYSDDTAAEIINDTNERAEEILS